MRLDVLHVPGCPGAALLEDRLAEVLAGWPETEVVRQVITTQEEAERTGMTGSPTLLVDGADPFPGPGQEAGISCRLYRDADGRACPAPSVAQLHDALGARIGSAPKQAPAFKPSQVSENQRSVD